MKRIALKLWLGMMTLVAIILVLLWLFQIVFLNNFYTSIHISDVEKSGQKIINEIVDLQKFKMSLDELAYNNNLTAELLDLQNNTVYTAGAAGTNGQMPMMMNAVRTEVYKKVLEGGKVQVPMTHPRFNSNYMLIGLPVAISGELEGALIITLPLAPVEDTASILKKQLVYITIILLFTTLLLTFILSKSFTKPILEISKVAKDMASGNLSARTKPGSRDEIGRLAETINYMGNELTKTEQLRKDLIANVSHELRTPLSLIKGYAETIRDVTGNNEEKREKQLGIIIEESDRLSGIVEDILNLSQMQAGYTALKLESFKLKSTVERLIKRYEILSESNGIKITCGKSTEAFVQGEEARIEQVLYNLINNACNHSPEGSSVRINMIEVGDRVRVEVSDSGEGIPADELKNIWDRFYKVDKSGKRKKAGTGLGLSIVKNILTTHDAVFGVDSVPDEGTTFWFELKKTLNNDISCQTNK